jgi:DNA mismatch endonuclease, patch repair protein
MAPKATRRDMFSPEERSALMSRIRGKNTNPEVRLRKALFALGLRYRLHSTKLPGKPDIVFTRHRAAVFVNGCFWHGHDCHLFKWPRSNSAFWRTKIAGNKRRDGAVKRQLGGVGWRTMTVWECSIRKASPQRFASVAKDIRRWLLTRSRESSLMGSKSVRTARKA